MPLRILLVNAPNEAVNANASNYACYPHIGIVQLATAARDRFGALVEVAVVDGGISDTETVIDEVQRRAPDVVGISALTPTYGEALRIAAAARRVGAFVVLGDDHAGFFPERVLRARPDVDCIVANDVGETPFVELVDALLGGRELADVSSLVHRRGEQIVRNPAPRYRLAEGNTVPDLAFIADTLPTYTANYRELFGHLHAHAVTPITVNNARGCENGTTRCTYCSIADLTVNTGAPEEFWATVDRYHEEFGVNLFFEVYDSFTASPRYITALIDAMPARQRRLIDDGDIELMVYARALGLTKRDNVERCRRLGIARVNIGLDAADPEILAAQRKNKTTEQTNLEAIRLLNAADISVHASYIAGAPGERNDSLDRTIDGIRQMLGEVELASVEFSRFIPLPNSPAWDILVDFDRPSFFRDAAEIDAYLAAQGLRVPGSTRLELRDRFGDEDLLDINALADVWMEHFTHVDAEHALGRIAEADAMITARHVNTGNNVG